MWAKVEKDLAGLLQSNTYSVLREVREYEKLLVAGVPDPVRCRNTVAEIVRDVQKSGGVREFGSRQRPSAGNWKKELFRAVSPGKNPYGSWWFDGELVQRWEKVYPGSMPKEQRRESILESLRPMLAVCYDWNDFTQLLVMKLRSGIIPVITGQGGAQPIFSPKAGQMHEQNKNVVFIGGYQQVYVPFVPHSCVEPYRDL
jgi:hypothetical protein